MNELPELQNPFEPHYWMQPHIFTGPYFEVVGTWGVTFIPGWEAGPQDPDHPITSRTVGKYTSQPLPAQEVEAVQRFGSIGCMVGRGAHVPSTPYMKGYSEQNVMDRLWEKYRFVLV